MKQDQISKIIPYLASKFTPNLFKRMQLEMNITQDNETFEIYDENLDQYRNINPKGIITIT